MGISQFVKRKIKERKEASEVMRKAKHEEKLRIQHLQAQRKLEEHKMRIEKAKESGRKAAIPFSARTKVKAKELKEKASPIAKRLFEEGKVAGLKFAEDLFKEQKKRQIKARKMRIKAKKRHTKKRR